MTNSDSMFCSNLYGVSFLIYFIAQWPGAFQDYWLAVLESQYMNLNISNHFFFFLEYEL